jgi:predicted RNA-binding protein with PUA-like domain
MRTIPELSGMVLLQKGSRLSVSPVTPDEWKQIVALVRGAPDAQPRKGD